MELSMPRGPVVLVVDDDPAIRKYLRRNLAGEGYRVRECASVPVAPGYIADQPPNLVILDVGLSKGGASNIIRAIREISLVPILATSAHGDETVMVEALTSGADDFIAKPFGLREMLARVESTLRRAIRQQGISSRFSSGDLKVDLLHRRVWSKDQEIHLSPKVYGVLRVLVEGAGKVLDHKDILRAVWGPSRVDRISYLRLAIRELRHAIETDPAHPIHILTEPRVGYRLRIGDRHESNPPARPGGIHERRTSRSR
jgi:two-component system KDP operon response regulator KdpE